MAEARARWSFAHEDTAAEYEDLEARCGVPHFDAKRGLFLFRGLDALYELRAPLIFPRPEPSEAGPAWLARCAEAPLPGRYLVLLFQAGAAAMGVFEEHVPVRHKVLKRYVIRGKGRAQATHLKTRGKSRYGSRLRLQNHELLLDEVVERLHLWWAEDAPYDAHFRSVPVRLLAELQSREPKPPEDPNHPWIRIPIDVRPPDFAELRRVYRFLSRGHVRPLPLDPAS